MKVAIMQPYFFPYIGYFQLIASIDKFVFYDDVNFIKNGWINRNRMFIANEVRYITIPLIGASSFLRINDIFVKVDNSWKKRMLESIRQSYSKAPYFSVVYDLLAEVLYGPVKKITDISRYSITTVSNYIGLKAQFQLTSAAYGNDDLKGASRIIDICKKEGCREYINLPGGRDLYNYEVFKKNGLLLRFIDPELKRYNQLRPNFIAGLSILDVLMFNDKKSALEMLSVIT